MGTEVIFCYLYVIEENHEIHNQNSWL